MKTPLLFLLNLLVISTSIQATTYYTCSTPNGTNVTTDQNGGGNCNVAESTWNQPGNILIVRNGTNLSLSGSPFIQNCEIEIEKNASLDFSAGGGNNQNNAYEVSADDYLIIFGEFIINTNNTTLRIDPGARVFLGFSGTIKNNGSNNNDINIDGAINGFGTIEWTGGIGGSGTINGNPIDGSETSPLSLSLIGRVWDGTSWTPSPPTSVIHNAIFEGDYQTSIHGSFKAGTIIIDTGYTLYLDNDDNIEDVLGILNYQGLIKFKDNSNVGRTVFEPAGTGSAGFVREITRTGWHQFGFPVVGTSTLGNMVTTGFSFVYSGAGQNIFRWDASISSWEQVSASTPLEGQAFLIYASPGELSLTTSMLDFNNDPLPLDYDYNNPGPSTIPPGNGSGWASTITDGWNLFINPLQDYLLSDELSFPIEFDGAIYVWNGTEYVTRVGGAGSALVVSPHQAYFIRRQIQGNGQLTIPGGPDERYKGKTSFLTGSYFKSSSNPTSTIVLKCNGPKYTTHTWLTENPNASTGFDPDFDALYFPNLNDAQMFNSVNIQDSISYSVQAFNDFNKTITFLSFFSQADQQAFTIGLDTLSNFKGSAILVDLKNGNTTDLTLNDYTFTNDTAFIHQRFLLSVHQNVVAIVEHQNENLGKAYFSDDILNVELLNDETVKRLVLSDLAGREIYHVNATHQDTFEIQAPPGIYILRLQTESGKMMNIKIKK